MSDFRRHIRSGILRRAHMAEKGGGVSSDEQRKLPTSFYGRILWGTNFEEGAACCVFETSFFLRPRRS